MCYIVPQNGPPHYEIASYSQLLDLSSTDLFSVLATFNFYAVAYVNIL